jgi:hypothetical protein
MSIKRLAVKLNSICIARYGVSYDDLPDLIFLSDYCWDGMTAKDVQDSAVEIIDELKAEGELPF